MKHGTTAKSTFKAIDSIFTHYDRPLRYRSDNGPPFDSKELRTYMQEHGIECEPSYPSYPQANPGETWMKPLGK